jgi:hypothetical protein
MRKLYITKKQIKDYYDYRELIKPIFNSGVLSFFTAPGLHWWGDDISGKEVLLKVITLIHKNISDFALFMIEGKNRKYNYYFRNSYDNKFMEPKEVVQKIYNKNKYRLIPEYQPCGKSILLADIFIHVLYFAGMLDLESEVCKSYDFADFYFSNRIVNMHNSLTQIYKKISWGINTETHYSEYLGNIISEVFSIDEYFKLDVCKAIEVKHKYNLITAGNVVRF